MNRHAVIAAFLLGATLALGFVLGMNIVAKGAIKARESHSVRVKGTAEAKIQSNAGSWSCSITARNKDLKFGAQKIASGMIEARAYLANCQVTANEISESQIVIEPVRRKTEKGNDSNDIDFYLFTQTITVKSSDVLKVDKISKGISSLIEKNIEIYSEKPYYVNTDIDKIKMELLGKAVKNAQERADTMTANSRGRTGRLLSASQGIFQITSPDSSEVSDEGTYDTSTIDKVVKAVVTLEFSVE